MSPGAEHDSEAGKATSVGAMSLGRHLLPGILVRVGMLVIINTVSLYRQALARVEPPRQQPGSSPLTWRRWCAR